MKETAPQTRIVTAVACAVLVAIPFLCVTYSLIWVGGVVGAVLGIDGRR